MKTTEAQERNADYKVIDATNQLPRDTQLKNVKEV
jgi:hypothetical protein